MKTLLDVFMTKDQRLLASYSKLNKISISSGSSHSESNEDKYIPKMLDNKITQQEHRKEVEKIFNKYLQQKLSIKDYQLMCKILA